uniref:ATP-binding cassette sub-family D n=1 Tax=Nephromyces sp. MMRI TaxID=2496275 RepID=A0A3Q8UC61_9APIC|nr:ATP-binding cassette sub-family D [Nephromyces sp. MMRI]AZL94685.1 ATP-binding cassette sub-family D [Nephromyces sp. MMRI]
MSYQRGLYAAFTHPAVQKYLSPRIQEWIYENLFVMQQSKWKNRHSIKTYAKRIIVIVAILYALKKYSKKKKISFQITKWLDMVSSQLKSYFKTPALKHKISNLVNISKTMFMKSRDESTNAFLISEVAKDLNDKEDETAEAVIKNSLSELSFILVQEDHSEKLAAVPSTGPFCKNTKFKEILSQYSNFLKNGLLHKGFLLWKLAAPQWNGPVTVSVAYLVAALISRTFLSIWIASINGSIVKSIVECNANNFLKQLGILSFYSIPSSFVNAWIGFCNKSLALLLRQQLSKYFIRQYLMEMTFYQMASIDSRILHPDQRLTSDLDKWAQSLASLITDFTKPLIDILLISRSLASHMGWKGPMAIIFWYILSAGVIRLYSPGFGRLAAEEQVLEGQYRSVHSSIVKHSEEIAFYRGNAFEFQRIMQNLSRLLNHSRLVLFRKLYMGCFDGLLIKYGALIVGYITVALPVFWPKNRLIYQMNDSTSLLTQDIVRNSSLLLNLAKAIGKIVISYKELQTLGGYTHLICQLHEVLDDLQKRVYYCVDSTGELTKKSCENLGQLQESQNICFSGVPVVTPKHLTLIPSVTLEVTPKTNMFILGPNGCGKSSLFRVLGGLWPLQGGILKKPPVRDIFYIPQKPYMPHGTLRDQIIYPDDILTFQKKQKTDADLEDLLKCVQMDYLLERFSNRLDECQYWQDILSGGEKQRMAIARLCYHHPVFAILDEATNAVSADVEQELYRYCKSQGICLITISHRLALMKFHDKVLRFTSQGQFHVEKISSGNIPRYESYSSFLRVNSDSFENCISAAP